MNVEEFISRAIEEDIGPGDRSALSTIPANSVGSAYLVMKANGIIAGLNYVAQVFHRFDPDMQIDILVSDGDRVSKGDRILELRGKERAILSGERLMLNLVQRMSGIATLTSEFVAIAEPYGVKILDTRKTTPLLRAFEKEAVRIGGGVNHRMGLYDMIMIKDNHADYCGGVVEAIAKAKDYLKEQDLDIPIEVETRNIEDARLVVECGGVQRLMLDNFTPEAAGEAIRELKGKIEIEISGGINLDTVESYAAQKPDFISVGSLTHSAKALDMSLKVQRAE